MAGRYHLGIVMPMRMSQITCALALLLVACEGNTPEPRAPERKARASRRCPPPRHRLVDLSQPLQENMPVWPGGVPFKMSRLSDYDQGYRLHKLEMGENVGTHVDAPSHFIQGKRSVGQIPVEELVLPAVMIDVHERAEKNPDYPVSAGDLGDWEAAHGELPPGSIVLVNTGWHSRFRDPPSYLNVDASGVLHFPGFAAGAAQLLLERDVAAAGIDTPSLDVGASKTFDVHKILLGQNRYGIENLTNLEKLPPTGMTVIVGLLPIAEGTEAQARVMAMVPEKDDSTGDEDPDATTESSGH